MKKNRSTPALKKDGLAVFSKWFHVSRYEDCEKLDASGWAHHLMFRTFLRNWILEEPSEGDRIDPTHLFAQMLEYPLGKKEPSPGPMLAKPGFLGVRDARIEDFWTVSRAIARDKRLVQAYQEFEALLLRDDHKFADEPEILNRSYFDYILENGEATEPFLKVDLSLPDEYLLDDFRRWLSGKRDALRKIGHGVPRRKSYSKSDFHEWTKKRALAYIDLDILCSWIKGRLSDHHIGELLFPDDTDVDLTERIRKVVRPCAQSLMAHATIEALDAQAARECPIHTKRGFDGFAEWIEAGQPELTNWRPEGEKS